MSRLSLALVSLAVLVFVAAGQPNRLADFSSVEDFQGDGLGQWASYPPAQDIGYEPSITPTSGFDAPGGRSLMRWVHPTRRGDLRIGFIKEVRFTVSNRSSVSFDARLSDHLKGRRIEIGVAGGDGNRYSSEVAVGSNGWSKTSMDLRSLRQTNGSALKDGTEVEAVFMIAHFEDADPDTVYRFLIDNVAISGSRTVGFEIITPASFNVDPWNTAISAAGFRTNDAVRLEVRSPVALHKASVTIKDPTGRSIANAPMYDDGTHGDRAARDGVWTNDDVHKFARDNSGLWIAEVRGTDSKAGSVLTSLRFLVHSEAKPHPRLYFDHTDRRGLVSRTHDPRLAKVWDYIQSTAKTARASGPVAHGGDVFELLDTEYLLPSLLGYFDVVNRARSRIAYNAFVAYLTDDPDASKSAKEALLAVSNWTRWEPPWFTAHGQHTYYPAGLLAVDVALGYDLLYDQLTEAERSAVRRALIEKQIVPTYNEYFLDNRAMANTSNWISHTVGGALIAAAAIAGDVTLDEADGKFDLYVNGLLAKIEAHMAASYLPDGSYGEGISYQEFDLETLAPMIYAVERAFGIDYWNTTHVKNSLRYALYTRTDPREASLDMGDTHPPAGFGISPLIYRSKDPVMRWYYSKFDRPSLQHFIFFDDSVSPKSPDAAGMPDSAIFEDKGNAVFRTGWGEDSIAMLFRAGPNFNHHHADQGSFLVTAYGEPLVTEAGWSDYYKDPYYATFFTQAVGHNTVLVNGNPESQIIPDTRQFTALDSYPKITDSITSESFDGVGSDLSSAYSRGIGRYIRRIVFVKPHYFVVYDDLEAPGDPARFNFLLHLPDRSGVRAEGSTAVYEASKATVGIRCFTPAEAVLTVKEGRIPYPVFSARTPAATPPQPIYLDLETAKASTETQFLTAIVPAKTSQAARTFIARMFPIASVGMKGIRVERGSETDLVMFRTGAEQNPIRHAEWSAEASVLMVTQEGSDAGTLAVQNARSVTNGPKAMFTSDFPVSIVARYKAQIVSVNVSSKQPAKVTLFTGSRPTEVSINSKKIEPRAFSYDATAGTISLSVSPGQHEIRISIAKI